MGKATSLGVVRKIGIMCVKCSVSHLAHSRHLINDSYHYHISILKLLMLTVELVMTFPLKEGNHNVIY